MSAQFQIYLDANSRFRFRLIADNGTVMLTSGAYAQEAAAIAAIASVRDIASTGSVVDLT